jgi:hypothetical protein
MEQSEEAPYCLIPVMRIYSHVLRPYFQVPEQLDAEFKKVDLGIICI